MPRLCWHVANQQKWRETVRRLILHCRHTLQCYIWAVPFFKWFLTKVPFLWQTKLVICACIFEVKYGSEFSPSRKQFVNLLILRKRSDNWRHQQRLFFKVKKISFVDVLYKKGITYTKQCIWKHNRNVQCPCCDF